MRDGIAVPHRFRGLEGPEHQGPNAVMFRPPLLVCASPQPMRNAPAGGSRFQVGEARREDG